MTVIENYFPFDSGAGATATPQRWRLMARQWSGNGVIPGYTNQCRPTLAGSVLSIDMGAVWIDGFCGENQSSKSFSVSGGDGLLVARMDPVAKEVLFVYTVGQTAPAQPANATGVYEISIARVTSGAMYDIRQFATGGPSMPSGVMMDFGGGTAPPGWLLCDGTSYLRTDWPGLFNAIGTTWGAADGSHFSVPDARGRAPVGAGGGYLLTNRGLGQYGGEENHTLGSSEMPSHAHSGSATTSTESVRHWHASSQGNGFAATGIGTYGPQPGGSPTMSGPAATTANNAQLHSHTLSVNTNNIGGGVGHNNMQPFLVVTKIIKT